MKIQKLLLSSVLTTGLAFNASSMNLSFDSNESINDFVPQKIENLLTGESAPTFGVDKLALLGGGIREFFCSSKRNTILAGGVFFATLAYNGFNAVSYFLNRSGSNTWLPKPNMYNVIAGAVVSVVSGYFFKYFTKNQSCVEENGVNNIITELNEQLEEVQDPVANLEGKNNDLNLKSVEKDKQDDALIISGDDQKKIVKNDPKDNQLEYESDDYNDTSDVENDFFNNKVKKPKVDMPKNNQYKDDYSDASDCYSDEKKPGKIKSDVLNSDSDSNHNEESKKDNKTKKIVRFEENNKILPKQGQIQVENFLNSLIHGSNIFNQTNVSGYNEVEIFFSRIYEKENEQAGNTTSFYEYFLKDDSYKICEENNKIYFLDKNGYGFIFNKRYEYIGLKNCDGEMMDIIFD